jgi:hypothetical protein
MTRHGPHQEALKFATTYKKKINEYDRCTSKNCMKELLMIASHITSKNCMKELLMIASHILPLDFSAQNKWPAHILDLKHIYDMVYHENLHILLYILK